MGGESSSTGQECSCAELGSTPFNTRVTHFPAPMTREQPGIGMVVEPGHMPQKKKKEKEKQVQVIGKT